MVSVARGSLRDLKGDSYSVVIAGRRAAKNCARLRRFACGGPDMLAVPTDVSQPDSVRALFARITATYGARHLLFNNAGISLHL